MGTNSVRGSLEAKVSLSLKKLRAWGITTGPELPPSEEFMVRSPGRSLSVDPLLSTSLKGDSAEAEKRAPAHLCTRVGAHMGHLSVDTARRKQPHRGKGSRPSLETSSGHIYIRPVGLNPQRQNMLLISH